MPRQNRVNPFGELIATSSHGLFMGNRGVLHNDQGQLTEKRWTHNHWIICLTKFKDRKRPLMSPGCYTELFFTDEATALAAGHRPCAECRRKAYNHFKQAWIKGNSFLNLPDKVDVDFIDKVLHEERVKSDSKSGAYRVPGTPHLIPQRLLTLSVCPPVIQTMKRIGKVHQADEKRGARYVRTEERNER